MTKVSVIIPVYNVKEYLRQCVDSVVCQSYSDIEILLINDGSTDGSKELCDHLAEQDDRIKVFHQENRGVVAARGVGVRNAIGKYILFVDGDDKIETNMIEVLIQQIGEADIISSGVYKYTSSEHYTKRIDGYNPGVYKDAEYKMFFASMLFDKETQLFQRFTPWLVNKLFRTELVQRVYDKLDENIHHTEDAVFTYLYLLHCNSVVIIHDVFYHYLYREDSVCHKGNDRMLMDINRGYLVLKDAFSKHELSEQLLYQLQKWVVKSTCFALNNHLGIAPELSVPEFLFNVPEVIDKKIVLYGAGKMGKDFKKQLEQLDQNVVLWVDKNYEAYRAMGLDVVSPKAILGADFDVLVLAISRLDIIENICADLEMLGISKEKIVWKKPVSIF